MLNNERWICFGRGKSGKSILGKKLIEEFSKANPTIVTQVVEPYLHGENVSMVRTMNLGYDHLAYNEFLSFKLD